MSSMKAAARTRWITRGERRGPARLLLIVGGGARGLQNMSNHRMVRRLTPAGLMNISTGEAPSGILPGDGGPAGLGIQPERLKVRWSRRPISGQYELFEEGCYDHARGPRAGHRSEAIEVQLDLADIA